MLAYFLSFHRTHATLLLTNSLLCFSNCLKLENNAFSFVYETATSSSNSNANGDTSSVFSPALWKNHSLPGAKFLLSLRNSIVPICRRHVFFGQPAELQRDRGVLEMWKEVLMLVGLVGGARCC